MCDMTTVHWHMKNENKRPFPARINSNIKRRMARLMHIPGVQQFMRFGIKLVVPRHRVGVALVALDNEERVFMLKHVFHPQAPWGLPAGWLNRNENPSHGILRELYEETGLTAKLGPPISIGYHPEAKHIGIVYLGEIEPGELCLSHEIIAAKWFSLTGLPDKILPFTQESIDTAVSMHRLIKNQMNNNGHLAGEKVEK